MPTDIIGVAQQFLIPPLNAMDGEAVPGNPQTGNISIQRVRGLIPVAAYGLMWIVDSTTAGIGETTVAGELFYDRDILWLKSTIQIPTPSTLIPYNVLATNAASGLYLFSGGYPASVEVTVYPGCAINLWWLVLL